MIKEIIIGASGIALAVVIIAVIRTFMTQKNGVEVESVYIDVLSIGDVKQWFSYKVTSDHMKGMILYPTPENITKWKLNIDSSKQSNMLIQAVYDKDKAKVVDYREIVFGSLSQKLKNLLDDKGGVLVIEI